MEIEIDGIRHTSAVTIIERPGQFDASFLMSKKANFLAGDDVFASGFLHTILVHLVDDEVMPETSIEVDDLLQEWDCQLRPFKSPDNMRLPEGPYFATPLGIYQAFRLYSDTHGAFILPTYPVVHDLNT